jgi:hypothetical protein
MENKQTENPAHKKLWKYAMIGVIVGCLIHYFTMVLIKDALHFSMGLVGVPTVVSFFACRWFIKRRIQKNGNLPYAPLFGFGCAMAVFMIQVVLGAITLRVTHPATSKTLDQPDVVVWTKEYEEDFLKTITSSDEVKLLAPEMRTKLAECFLLKYKIRFPKGLDKYPEGELKVFGSKTGEECAKQLTAK